MATQLLETRRAQMFPKLTPAQLARLEPHSERRGTRGGRNPARRRRGGARHLRRERGQRGNLWRPTPTCAPKSAITRILNLLTRATSAGR